MILGDRGHLVPLGSLAPRDPLARGVLLAVWDMKAEKGRRGPRGHQVQMAPLGRQALWVCGAPLDVRGQRVCVGSPDLWGRLACWDPQDRRDLQVPWVHLASQG